MGLLILNHDADAFRQEIYIRDLNLEFTSIELAESVKSAQVATATLYEAWQQIKKNTLQNRLTNFLRSNEHITGNKYYNQGEPRNSDY